MHVRLSPLTTPVYLFFFPPSRVEGQAEGAKPQLGSQPPDWEQVPQAALSTYQQSEVQRPLHGPRHLHHVPGTGLPMPRLPLTSHVWQTTIG